MGKSFRFLLQFAVGNLASLLGFAALVIAGCYLTGAPAAASSTNLFEKYYAMFPLMVAFCLFLFAFALCTSNLRLGLSMGARRSGFFWALQGIILFYMLACWALQLFMSAFPGLAGWAARDRWLLLGMFDGRPWAYPLICGAVMILGCLSGMLMVRHKVLGTLVVVLSVFAMIGITMVLMLLADTSMMDFLYDTQWGGMWSALPGAMAAGLALTAVGGEYLIWRAIQRFVVR